MATATAGKRCKPDAKAQQVSRDEERRRESITRLRRLKMYRHADGYVYQRVGVVCDPSVDRMIAFGWDAAIHIVLGQGQAA